MVSVDELCCALVVTSFPGQRQLSHLAGGLHVR